MSELLARKVGDRVLSEGQRLFQIVTLATKHLAIASSLRCSERFVGELAAGLKRPSAEMIARLWLAYEIRGELWGLAPLDETELVAQRSLSPSGALGGTVSKTSPIRAA